MAFATLLRKRKPQGMMSPGVSAESGAALALTFDCIVSESPTFEAQPTQNPVEKGATVSDHVMLLPDKLSLRVIISNTPISILTSLKNLISDDDAVSYAMKFLVEARDAREPFDLVTDMRTYKDMVIVQFNPKRDASTGSTLDFTLNLQKILIVESILVQVPKGIVRSGYASSASSEENTGKQATESPLAALDDKGSILYQGYDPIWTKMGVIH
jgi:hypothetical protein